MKKVSEQVVIGQRGVNLIERYVLEMGHAWNASTIDAGIDGRIELCNPETREALNHIILVQSKATTRRFPGEDSDKFEWSCDARDVDYWMQGNAPVILVVSRFLDGIEEAYWIDVKRYFADPARRKTSRARFDKNRDRFDATCTAALLDVAKPVGDGIYLGPPPVREELHSNLLRVTALAEHIYTADTDFSKAGQVWARFKELGIKPGGGEWALRGNRLLSFRDLGEGAFRRVVDPGTVERHDTQHWAGTEDDDLRKDFVQLLNQTLSSRLYPLGIRFDRDEKYYHFMATRNLRTRRVSYRSRIKNASRDVFKPYPNKKDPKRISYYRHLAFKGQFRRYDSVWYLEIMPTYRYTSDGYRVHPFAQEYLKRIKEDESNDAVSGQVIMWASLLADQGGFLDTAEFLRFGGLETFSLDVGVDDASWKGRGNEELSESNSDDDEFRLALE